MATHNAFGKWGEEIACQFLTQKGYSITQKNYRFRKGEIDIIAQKAEEIVFVEVRTRSNEQFVETEESISRYKEELLIETASHYIESKNIDLDARFDVIIIIGKSNPEIRHYEGAIEP